MSVDQFETVDDLGAWFASRPGSAAVHVPDRDEDLIVSGEENDHPAEVGNAILGHLAVAGEAVKAVVVLEPGAEAGQPRPGRIRK